MGTHFFQKPGKMQPSGQNLEARAISAPGYSGRVAGGRAQKDLGAAASIYKSAMLKPTANDAASNARGPKKV